MKYASILALLFAASVTAGGTNSPYGVCAHLHRVRSDTERADECRWIASTGIRRVRFDMEWRRVQKEPGAPFDFSHYDKVVADAEAQGLTPLPILFDIPKWAEPVWEHLDEWGAFVEAVVTHYGDRFPDIEIWNEENHSYFWKHDPDPAKYAEVLKTAYLAAKRGGKAARSTSPVAFGDSPLSEGANSPTSAPLREGGGPERAGGSTATATNAILSGEAALNGCGGSSAATAPRVLFGGTAGVPLGFIEGVYKAGGAPFFDAMNIHPYSHPRQPEGHLDVKLEATRALMAKYGDADKPILITELGWPTHNASLGQVSVLRTGLALAKPDQKTWRVVYAATSPSMNGGGPPVEIAEAIEAALPPGSSCEACFGARLRERLAAGDVDAVFYPFDETFPVDTFEEVRAFVEAGGVLVDAGGMPLWYCMRETEPGVFTGGAQEGAECRKSLGLDVDAWWINPALKNAYIKANPTDAALAAGFQGDPAGENADRFQTPRLLGPDDEFIPILTAPISPLREGGVAGGDGGSTATATNEKLSGNAALNRLSGEATLNGSSGSSAATAVAASVIRRAGGRRGCVVVSGLRQHGAVGTNSEDNQARYLARAMAIAFAEGVEQYFWYEFRGREIDPHYSEHHFGLTHSNFTPKPAWGAYRNFILARPAGSVQTPGPWHDEKRSFFFPQWTRPDGTKAGIIWKTGEPERRELRFETGDAGGPPAAAATKRGPPNGDIRFRDFTGRTLKPVRSDSGTYVVPLSGSPIFFEGGALSVD
jgi:hypothetical protein